VLREFEPPGILLDHALEFLRVDGRIEPVTPRASATVLLLRDGDPGSDGPEVFVLRRAASMAFAARMHAFPGGGVDPRDADLDVPWAGPAPARWAELLGADEPQARSLVCAAVRELFEECGVLLAGPDESSVVADLSDPSWEDDRLALLDHSLALSQMLTRRGLVLRTDLLRAWSHWTTPRFEPRRYSTRFFVAALPDGQTARDVGGEADRAEWVAAGAAVSGFRAGRMAMLPPTILSLEEVARWAGVAQVLAAPRVVRPVMPWLVARSDGTPSATESLMMRVDVDGLGGGRPGPENGFERVVRVGTP
jgi:8-oxo-dGTP pyrophosphatase MutT (NUDIX family)